MRISLRCDNARPQPRPAFTLVELMVVVALIGILAALVAAAVTRAIPAQQQRNTEMTLRKIDAMLKSHWRAVVEDAKEEFDRKSNPALVNWLNNNLSFLGNDMARAKVIWVKMRCVQQFPMNYGELFFPTGVPLTLCANGPVADANHPIVADSAYWRLLTQRTGINPFPLNGQPPKPSVIPPASPAQAGACLLLALTAKAHKNVKHDEDYFSSGEKADTDGDGQLELVDAWGKPLLFYRWPAGNPDVQALRPTTGIAQQFPDPLDPTGKLFASFWNNNTNAATVIAVEQLIKHPIHQGSGQAWTPYPYYLIPTAVSAGMDGQLSLDQYMTPGTTGYDTDNIYSFLLK
jgi:prepilin-type N-terminal cleavage/methylation domain-containing protein